MFSDRTLRLFLYVAGFLIIMMVNAYADVVKVNRDVRELLDKYDRSLALVTVAMAIEVVPSSHKVTWNNNDLFRTTANSGGVEFKPTETRYGDEDSCRDFFLYVNINGHGKEEAEYQACRTSPRPESHKRREARTTQWTITTDGGMHRS